MSTTKHGVTSPADTAGLEPSQQAIPQELEDEVTTTSPLDAAKTPIDKLFAVLATLVAVVLCIFHLLAASPLITLNNTEMAVIHGGLIMSFFLLIHSYKKPAGKALDLVMIAITVLAAAMVIQLRNTNATARYTDYQKYLSVAFIVVSTLVAYRALGKILPTLCVAFLAYAMIGQYLPGDWATVRFTMNRVPGILTSSEGLFGNALSTAANFIFLFVIFGSVLSFIGAGEFFVKIAFAAFGRVCGGPAQAAVYSSMLMGMVNGSGAANVVTTGTFTIPLMKRTGFDKDTAGAIEAVASNGGQIMPPVMGAVAFLMANATNLPYTTICLAALIPAVLYYLTLSASIAAYAHKHRIPVREAEEGAETVGQIFKQGWYYFLPIFVLIFMMVSGFSTQRSALVTIGLCAVIGLVTDYKRFTAKNLMNLCVSSARSIMSVSIACLIVGLIVWTINFSGLGLKISGLIATAAHGSTFLMGLLTAIVCIILGMGLPTSACYIVLSVLVAPAMTQIGIAAISAHMFVLYYGVAAAITPPVALAVFAAIGISGGDMWKTGLQSIKMAMAGLVIPFIFLYNVDLLMFNPVTQTFGFSFAVAISFVTALIGCVSMALSLFGWCFRDLKVFERIIMLVCSVFLMLNNPLWINGVGLIGCGAIAAMAYLSTKKKKEMTA